MRFAAWIAEQIETVFSSVWGGLRSQFRVLSTTFFPSQPRYDKTVINYDLARQLYRNDGSDTSLGAGFCRPIIDRSVEFMGIPIVTTGAEDVDNRLNDNLQKHWKPQLVEMFRNSMRDSKTVVRMWRPSLDNPLVTEEEREACTLQLVDPERVTIVRSPQDPSMITEAVIVSHVPFDVTSTAASTQPSDPPRGARPTVSEHEIWEILRPDSVRFYDRTDQRWLPQWEIDNPYGFVPLIEVWNEYDSTLSGGQSDFEGCYPFVKAFHEVMRQGLQAHRYHSTPKVKFKVADILAFLKNNFPETLDANGNVVPGSTIKWDGKEVMFINSEEDVEFIELRSVLDDTKTLLEFLIDCISIASETPEWAFMRVEAGASEGAINAQTLPFEKKIERKRINFQPFIQMICKMCQAINGDPLVHPEVLWDEVRVDTLIVKAQAFSSLVTGLELLLQRNLISDNTARETLRPYLRRMKSADQEAEDAKDNIQLPATQPQPIDNKNGAGNPDNVPAPVPVTGGKA